MDNALVFFMANPAGCQAIKGALEDFCAASRAMVNLQKSFMILSPNVTVCFKELLKGCLEVDVKKELGKYLGLPIMFSSSKSKDFGFFIDAVNDRLSSWSTKCFVAGRKIGPH